MEENFTFITTAIDNCLYFVNTHTVQKGLLPFADYSDWGVVCFDSNNSYGNTDYNISYIDHENPDVPKAYKFGRFTFSDLVKEMNERLKQWKLERSKRN